MRNTVRLNELITQMLDISKLDAAQYTLHPTAGNVTEFIRGLAGQYDAQAKEKGIIFTATCDDFERTVLFDRDAIEKISSNLAGNAIKYTPAGGSAGFECAVREKDNAATLSIVVWDSGPGIPASEHQQIFDRFYRAAPQRARADEQHTVLLVEDDADILSFNKSQLEEEGYHILSATNGLEAQNVLQATMPDIIVTDLMMPVMDGMALLQEVRANSAWAHLPVIILSAKASLPARVEGITGGAQAYLAKPFSPTELKGLIKNQLSLLAEQKARYLAKSADSTIP
eukprot:gene34573-biopygen19807